MAMDKFVCWSWKIFWNVIAIVEVCKLLSETADAHCHSSFRLRTSHAVILAMAYAMLLAADTYLFVTRVLPKPKQAESSASSTAAPNAPAIVV